VPWQPNRGFAILLTLLLSPIYFIGDHFGHRREGFGIVACTMIMIVAARQHWRLTRDDPFGYWTVILLGILVQIPLVQYIPWGERGISGVSLLPVGLAYYGILWVGFKFFERGITESKTGPEDTEHPQR
jgi:hypothetical protein